MQISFSIFSGDITTITIFSFILSLISIVSSTFEYISLQYLLQTEAILSMTFYIESNDICQMNSSDFKQLTNYKRCIAKELSKYFEINSRVIEILKPIQTRNGINMTFHIRINAISVENNNINDNNISGHEKEIHPLVKMVNDNKDIVCAIIFNQWKSRFPKVSNQGKIIHVRIREMRPISNPLSLTMSTDLNELEQQIKHKRSNAVPDTKVAAVSDEPQIIYDGDTDGKCNDDNDSDTIKIVD